MIVAKRELAVDVKKRLIKNQDQRRHDKQYDPQCIGNDKPDFLLFQRSSSSSSPS